MNVYLAARFGRRPELVQYADELESNGITVSSRWLRGDHEWSVKDDEAIPVSIQARFAQDDIDDLMAADVVVCFTESPRIGPARGGRHVEAGYALAMRKQVICVGYRENIFYALPRVIHCEEWVGALHILLNAVSTGIPVVRRLPSGEEVAP